MPSSRTYIGVVFGGESREHAVSIRSARTVINALKCGNNKKLFKIIPIYIDQSGRWWPAPIAESVLLKGCPAKPEELPQPLPSPGFNGLAEISDCVDIWFPVLHGPNGEDGTVQGVFTLMKKPFVGSGVLGSAVGMDKLAMKSAFFAAGLPQVPFTSVNGTELTKGKWSEDLLRRIENKLGYPCFVKPANLGSSVGITKAINRDQLTNGLNKAVQLDQRIVVEKGVTARELECAVLGKRKLMTSVVGEIRFDADWYDYDTKYFDGRIKTLIPAPLPKELERRIREMTLQACRALDVHGIARVDFFYDDFNHELWINEVNTLPGFTSQSMYPLLWQASGVTLEQLVSQLVDSARE